jgi:hypothetical protein
MAEQKEKREIVHSPKGVAIYPYLNRPDTKFDAKGVYKVDLRVPGDEADDLIAKITATQEEAAAMAKKKAAEQKKKGKKVTPKEADLPYFEACDEDGNETGEVVFRFKSTASGVSKKTGKKWQRKIPLFDSKGKPSKASVYGGSTLIVAFTVEPWVNPKCEYGVKLQMEAVQIIELVTGSGQRSATEYGFGTVEGGYEADDESEDDEDEGSSEDGSQDGGEDQADDEDF